MREELLSLDNYITTSMLYDTDSNGHYFLTEAGKKLSRHINSSINFVSSDLKSIENVIEYLEFLIHLNFTETENGRF